MKSVRSNNIDHQYQLCFEKFKPIMQKYINITVETILKYLRDFCISIYLIGSFGRGEGALYCENDVVQPVRDFDVLIITTKHIDRYIIRLLTNEIHEKLGLTSPTKAMLEDFSIWITYSTISELLKTPPLLKYYELRTASKHLYGIDIRKLINIELMDLSLYNGILILFTKVNGLLTLYPLSPRTHKRVLNYVYEILKTYTEIPTVFSLLDKSIYRPTFSERCEKFYREYAVKLQALFKFVPTLDLYIPLACKNRKILELSLINNIDLEIVSKHVLESLDKIISLYIKLGYGINMPLKGFSESDYITLDKVGLFTLAEFISKYLEKTLIRNRFLAKILGLIAARAYIQYSNIVFFMKARRERLPIKFSLIFSTKNQYVYSTYIGINMLRSLINDKKYDNEEYLKAYLDPSFVNKLKNVNQHIKAWMVMRILARLMRLADVSLHRKAF
ncbi:MAG: hypothetical protein QW604_03990 [Fervidicoccaceae archaeon]